MLDKWDVYNEFLLHGDLDRFTKIFARYDLFKSAFSKPGDIVECGVFKGVGLLFWAKLLEIFCPNPDRKVIGFDTFAGYPETDIPHDKEFGKHMEETAGYRTVSTNSLYGIAEVQGLRNRIELMRGRAEDTIPEYVKENPGFRISLLHLDFDTYTPTKTALECLWPLVVPDGLVVFDDYGVRGCGESDAVDEYFRGQKMKLNLGSFLWAKSPTAYTHKGGM